VYDAVVVGCGRMGAFTSEGVRRHAPDCWLPLAHADAVRAHPALRLAALADTDTAALERARAALGGVPGSTDPMALLAERRAPMVCIATRTIGRAALIEHAVASGARALHVEKPLCNTLAELQRLEALLAREDLFVTLGAVRRHLAPYRHARAIAESGRLGALREIRVDMGLAALYWTHPHSVDLLLFGAGGRRVQSVAARLAGVEPAADGLAVESDPKLLAMSVLFDDGVEGRIGSATGFDFTLVCERGSVLVENDGHHVRVRSADGGEPYPDWHDAAPAADPTAGAPGGTLAALTPLVQALQGDASARAANAALKRDILLGQRLLFAAVLSHRQGGTPVPPDALPDTLAVWARTGGRPA
jgi:predicted dehydrogenase